MRLETQVLLVQQRELKRTGQFSSDIFFSILYYFFFPKKIMSVLLSLIKHTKGLIFMFSVNRNGLFQQEGLLRSYIVLQLLN